MKNIFLFIISLFYFGNCFAQDTIEIKNWLTDSVVERFHVIKTDKKTRNGLYRALFKRKRVVAQGNYTNNKKTGTWNFYKPNGQLVQRYDYDKDLLPFESPYDTLYDVRYLFDKTFKETDTLTRPVKVGGIYYGFLPYLNLFRVPFDTFGVNTDSFNATIELLISPLGRLADYKVRLYSPFYQYDSTYHFDVQLLNEEDRQFIPSTYNGETILSRIVIRCFVEENGTLDFD